MQGTRARALLSLVLLSAGLHATAVAGEIVERDRTYYAQKTEAHVYRNASGQTLPYRLFVPGGYDPKKTYPLLLSLHGAGSRGSDNLKQLRPWVAGWLDDDIQKRHPCIILMPQCPAGQQWVDTPWKKGSYSTSKIPISKPMTLVREILEKILEEKSIDRSRIYVMGASMGGYGTWDFTMRHPDLVAAAIPVCGGGDPSMAGTLKPIPIWAFHGDKDTTVPPSGSQDMVRAIEKAGGERIKLTIYQGVKHDSYKRAWREPELVEWVFKQTKR
jgi:predicted peptidase